MPGTGGARQLGPRSWWHWVCCLVDWTGIQGRGAGRSRPPGSRRAGRGVLPALLSKGEGASDPGPSVPLGAIAPAVKGQPSEGDRNPRAVSCPPASPPHFCDFFPLPKKRAWSYVTATAEPTLQSLTWQPWLFTWLRPAPPPGVPSPGRSQDVAVMYPAPSPSPAVSELGGRRNAFRGSATPPWAHDDRLGRPGPWGPSRRSPTPPVRCAREPPPGAPASQDRCPLCTRVCAVAT